MSKYETIMYNSQMPYPRGLKVISYSAAFWLVTKSGAGIFHPLHHVDAKENLDAGILWKSYIWINISLFQFNNYLFEFLPQGNKDHKLQPAEVTGQLNQSS